MCCPNTLQWQWRICVDLRWLNVCNGCCFGAGQTVGTFVFLRVHLNWAVLLVIDAVWCRHQLTLNYVFKYIKMAMTALRWLDLWNGCRVGQTERTFALLCALELERVIIGVWSSILWGRNLTLMRCSNNALHYNGVGGSALIFFCWMYGTGVVLGLDEQRVRCITVCVFACFGLCY